MVRRWRDDVEMTKVTVKVTCSLCEVDTLFDQLSAGPVPPLLTLILILVARESALTLLE